METDVFSEWRQWKTRICIMGIEVKLNQDQMTRNFKDHPVSWTLFLGGVAMLNFLLFIGKYVVIAIVVLYALRWLGVL